MIANIINDYFGYAVATDNIWAAVTNPNSLRFNALTSSILRTGSLEVYKYNINTDTHDKKAILYRTISDPERTLLSTEINPPPGFQPLHTEYTGAIPLTSDKDILIDEAAYFTSSEDGFGYSVDINGFYMAVGCPYFNSTASFPGTASLHFTGSGQVDLYDLTRLDIDPYADRTQPYVTSFGTASNGFITASIFVPSNQQFSFVVLQSRDSVSDPWTIINATQVTNAGGNITLATSYTTLGPHIVSASGVVGIDPYLTSILNPDTATTNSFGTSVSINSQWLAVGSPWESGSGAVYIYKQIGTTQASWSLFQTLTAPSGYGYGDQFGYSLCLNKATGSYSSSLVVGSNKLSQSRVYTYDFNGTNWNQTFTLSPDYYTLYPLTFYPTLPVTSALYPNFADHFGFSVASYKDTIIVGAPTDRYIYEYSGSSLYEQGAVYFFERCPNPAKGYYLAKKSYGDQKILTNNNLGFSVGIYNNYAAAGSPKINVNSSSICYLRGTLFQGNYCGEDPQNTVDGQFILFQQVTSSILPDTTGKTWDIVNTYQIKKRIMEPYRDYGFSVDVSDSFVMVGAPFIISGSNRIMDVSPGTGSFTGSLDSIGDLSGKAYIYNLKNLRPNFYVGNVFYRNGKMVIMSSGSAFDGLLLVNPNAGQYEYDVNFTSKQIIFEKQVVCAVDIGEFNVSTNPTAVVLPTASFDINNNGFFDFQDADVLLSYMKYKSTEASGHPDTNWSASVIATNTDEEISVYSMWNSLYGTGSGALFTSSYSYINNHLFTSLDVNEDNRIDINDMLIMWKYFINRLTQKNYETYITPSSKKKFLSQVLDFLNQKAMKGVAPAINPNFFDYARLSQANPTGSYLAPYVTTIGLYDGADLVAVAKLGSPIKITPDFPMNFIVKMDF